MLAGEGMGSYSSMVAVSIWDNENVLEIYSGDGCQDTVNTITDRKLHT